MNTNFYHLHANQRRKTNSISSILDSNGLLQTDQQIIAKLFSSFYGHLVTTSNLQEVYVCLQDMTPMVSYSMNGVLLAEFTATEVQQVVFQMTPFSAPRPDGFSTIFYQKHWSTVGREVTNFALNVLNHSGNMEHINDTYVTLIPKVQKATRVGDF